MFTGLIREFADVLSYTNNILTLRATYKPAIGDSIAINGACLTVIELFEGGFSVELSLESRSLLALENLKGKVHMEPALALGDRLDGHMVQGHVDCVGVIEKLNQRENGLDIEVSIPKASLLFVIPKGSVSIDGVSLTVNEVMKEGFRLTIIPHTLEKTLIASYKVGRRVNVETDMFARYLYHMFHKKEALDWNGVDRIMATY
ncbi:riboflavin synthase [Sulfurospirillum deleyianum]|uniref:Riboflavin synthase n=1 Tax=Sulfurospirillum deleyianum (strain ATCC 51133 / DSM 6946 / 5175) TaxID=525898 RepID=D1B420_SULD5|nr:riboflavin synthase [Sulfurospirillum deleyianum]ACZ12840.1 riboflavin synthase, alpha subunit [Sulfurospirillum deleyianum DSM 6946]